jgi:hypothetical protein
LPPQGIPCSGPRDFPAAISASAFFACCNACSRQRDCAAQLRIELLRRCNKWRSAVPSVSAIQSSESCHRRKCDVSVVTGKRTCLCVASATDSARPACVPA